MNERRRKSAAQELLRLGIVASFVSLELVTLAPAISARVVEASVMADRRDNDKEKDKKESKRKDDDKGEDFVLNGQVLEIDTRKDPPEMIVGTVDGRARVRVLKTDEIARNGVHVGDSVELTGEKINEQLFEATAISVSERTGDAHDADDDSDDEDD